MGASRALKNRIRSTKNIKQITRAMEAVSAVKMRKSEQAALSARPYALAALQILKNVTANGTIAHLHPYLSWREAKKICLVVITSDKGLAGAFNSNVLRESKRFIDASTVPVDIVAVGKKGRDFFKTRGYSVVKEFLGIGDSVTLGETLPIAECVADLFVQGTHDHVVVIYTNFLSALKQEVVKRKLLPFTKESLESIVSGIVPLRGKYSRMPAAIELRQIKGEHTFEPGKHEVLETIMPQLLKIEVHHAVLEANASEHSSRMIAMRNASDNAGELIDSLTIKFNKSRQAQITKELTEITAGREALSNS